jgi:hypothetical protein
MWGLRMIEIESWNRVTGQSVRRIENNFSQANTIDMLQKNGFSFAENIPFSG